MKSKTLIFTLSFIFFHVQSCRINQEENKIECPQFKIDENWAIKIPDDVNQLGVWTLVPFHINSQNNLYEEYGDDIYWYDTKPGETMHLDFDTHIIPNLFANLARVSENNYSSYDNDIPFRINDVIGVTIYPPVDSLELCGFYGDNSKGAFYNLKTIECPLINLEIIENFIIGNIKFDTFIWGDLRMTYNLISPGGNKLKSIEFNKQNKTFKFGPVVNKGFYQIEFVSINDNDFKNKSKYPFESCFPICKEDKTILRIDVQ